MSYRGPPYQSGYGTNASMHMPMPSLPTQTSYQPYPTKCAPGYTRQTTPYPSSTSTAAMSSDIDAKMKELTDDLINGVISSAQNEDLEGLINNDEKINELIMDSQITKDIKRKREEMASFNKDQAVTNLSLKPELENLKEKLEQLSQRQNELRDNYLSLQNRLGNTSSIDTIFNILQAAVVEKETISDQIKNNFYDGDMPVDDFIKDFVEERKLYQLRKIKSEKMTLLLQNQPGQVPTSMPGYRVNQAVRYQQPPYPAHPVIPPQPSISSHHVPHSQPPPIPPPRGYYGGYNPR